VWVVNSKLIACRSRSPIGKAPQRCRGLAVRHTARSPCEHVSPDDSCHPTEKCKRWTVCLSPWSTVLLSRREDQSRWFVKGPGDGRRPPNLRSLSRSADCDGGDHVWKTLGVGGAVPPPRRRRAGRDGIRRITLWLLLCRSRPRESVGARCSQGTCAGLGVDPTTKSAW
jgi:hypothetical protein